MFTHTETFTQRRFYAEKLLNREAFTHSKLLHTKIFCTQQAFTHSKPLHTEHLHTVLLHMASVYTHRNFYTEAFNHREAFTHKLLHREALHTASFHTQQAFTHRTLTHSAFTHGKRLHTLDKNGSLYDPAGTESCNMQIRRETNLLDCLFIGVLGLAPCHVHINHRSHWHINQQQ